MNNTDITFSGWRMILIIGFFVLLLSLLLARLVDIQLLHGSTYREWADNNRVFQITTPLKRGVIFDRYGQTLTYTIPAYIEFSDPDRLFGGSVRIPREQALRLVATESAKVGYIPQREYPYGSSLAHTIGYTGALTAEEQKEYPELLPVDTVGKYGLEKYFDLQLRGTHGNQSYEIDAMGTKKKLLSEKVGKTGLSIKTTLDPFLSQQAERAMASKKGAVVITDAQTGAVLSLISMPTFNPNVLAKTYVEPDLEKARQASVSSLLNHPDSLFFNRAIHGSYPPGSLFKIVTAVAGLETDSFSAQTTVEDTGVLKVGDYSYSNWYYTQYGRVEGTISIVRALARSNDIFFYKAAEWVGPVDLAEFARLFGFGSKTGIEFASESTGIVPNPAWKEETLGERWFLGNTYHFGIGQGDMTVTPLQIAQMMQAIGNGGMKCHPTLIYADNYQCDGLGFHEDNIGLVLEGMIQACSPGGTAYPFFELNAQKLEALDSSLNSREKVAEGVVACKTGTAEFGGTNAQGYKNTHGWFSMIIGTEPLLEKAAQVAGKDLANSSSTSASTSAEIEKKQNSSNLDNLHDEWFKQIANHGFPKFITITVLVESDDEVPFREGSVDAAPVAKEIVDWMMGE